MKDLLDELRSVPPGRMFAWSAFVLMALSIVVIGDKLDGMAAAIVAGVGIGAVAGAGSAIVGAVLFFEDDGEVQTVEAVPDEVLEAIEDLRLYVTSASLLGADIDEPTEEAMLTVWAWMDQMKGERA